MDQEAQRQLSAAPRLHPDLAATFIPLKDGAQLRAEEVVQHLPGYRAWLQVVRDLLPDLHLQAS